MKKFLEYNIWELQTVYNNSNADLTGLLQCGVMTVAEIESLLPGKHPMVAINVWCC